MYTIFQVSTSNVIATASDLEAAKELCNIFESMYGICDYTAKFDATALPA